MFSVVTRVLRSTVHHLAFSFLAYRITARVVRQSASVEAVRRVMLGQAELEIPEVSSRDEIGLLTRTFNDMIQQQRAQREEIEETNRSLKDRNHRLQQMNEVLNQLSITDGLTKLHNHRFFQDQLTREIRRVERTGEPLSMLVIDIDDFKRLNDRQGHSAGDEILKRIADILPPCGEATYARAAAGVRDPRARHKTGAPTAAEKVRTSIAERRSSSTTPAAARVTVSIGVAAFKGSRKLFFRRPTGRSTAQGRQQELRGRPRGRRARRRGAVSLRLAAPRACPARAATTARARCRAWPS